MMSSATVESHSLEYSRSDQTHSEFNGRALFPVKFHLRN